MFVLQERRATVRLALLAAAVLCLGACADQVAAPERSGIRAANHAQRDDQPPDTPCPTGWQEVEGIWICPPG